MYEGEKLEARVKRKKRKEKEKREKGNKQVKIFDLNSSP